MPTGKQASTERTITISIGKELVIHIDHLAKKDNRSRSNWIVRELEAAVKIYEEAQLILPPVTRVSAQTLSSTESSRLNEEPSFP